MCFSYKANLSVDIIRKKSTHLIPKKQKPPNSPDLSDRSHHLIPGLEKKYFFYYPRIQELIWFAMFS